MLRVRVGGIKSFDTSSKAVAKIFYTHVNDEWKEIEDKFDDIYSC